MQQLTIETGEITLHACRWPAPGKPAVILLHGMTGCGLLWQTVAEGLHPDYDVIAPDLRGHGRSSKPADSYTTEALAGDIFALMDRLGVAQAAVVGHSVGARVAWYMAFLEPDRVSRLVIEDQFPDSRQGGAAYWQNQLDGWPVRFAARADGIEFLRRKGRNLDWWAPSLVEAADGGYTWGFTLEALLKIDQQVSQRDDWPVLIRTECPALVIRGARSPHLSHETARRMGDALNCPVITIPDADHWVHGRQPQAVIQCVRDFLAQT